MKKLRAVFIIVCVCLVLFGIYQFGIWVERRLSNPDPRGEYLQQRGTSVVVDYQGKRYVRRSNVTSILLMGIDNSSTETKGQADFLQLVVIDDAEKTVSRLQIDRDTMTSIVTLGVLGDVSGSRIAQISLSYGMGTEDEQSCELTVQAVSGFLLGVPIDYYAAMDLDGISVLNDSVGGVEVTLEDDFSVADPLMVKGVTLTLDGGQAEIFVRSRRSLDNGTNEARMARQESYVESLLSRMDASIRADQDFVSNLYDGLSPFLTTDMGRGTIINTVWTARDYYRGELLKISGEHKTGSDGFMQFRADDDSLYQTVLGLFFEIEK